MEILYVSKLCSQKKFDELFNTCQIKPQQQAQKFHQLLVNGFTELEDVRTTVLSDLPISRIHTQKVWFNSSFDNENKTVFKYLPHLNLAVIGQIITFITAFFYIVRWCIVNNNKKKFIICDVLNLSLSIAAKTAAAMLGVRTVAIVTDLPVFMQTYGKKTAGNSVLLRMYTLLCNYFMRWHSAYVVLTEQMIDIVNPKGKPYVIIEGMVDFSMEAVPNLLEGKYKEKVLIYAGALYEKYGVKKLIEAFKKVPLKDARLWLFGSGELEGEMSTYEKEDNRLKYLKVVPNKQVVEKEIKATLLVNPRPSYEEFTKYSFPSKNMEYMVSGTPILTTPLPGMPKDYYNYVYVFEDESEAGMAKKIEEILNHPIEKLHEKGMQAKKFVLREKNNKIQAEKIINMINY